MSPDDKLQRARERALPLLRECEGIRLMPYTDAAGLLTVGIGHRTSDRRPITIKRVYELADADMRAAQSAFAELNGALNVNQLAALTSFVFNIGGGAFASSTMRKLLLSGRVPEAARQFGVWNKATINGVLTVLPGLVARREAERDLFLCERGI